MSNIVTQFMKKELTCLPNLFNKYISKSYNNAIGNGLTWLFFIWLALHFAFDKFLNGLLKQMKYPEYFRQRVISTLWSFGFSFFSFIYCLAILSNNNFKLSELHLFNQFLLDKSTESVPGQYILGFVILSAYFAQNAIWEGSQNGFNDRFTYNILLTVLIVFTYAKGWTELIFALISISCLAQSVLEIAKMFFMQIYNTKFMKQLSTYWFGFHCVICFIMYAIILPLQFLIPCGKNFKKEITLPILMLNLMLWAWYISSLTQSAIYKVAKHYVYHMSEFNQTECKLNILECCMFPPRTDAAYQVDQVRKEIERRREMLINQRKKPNKLALYQTLKCMVTVKRKLKQRRANLDDSSSPGSSSTPTSSADVSPCPSRCTDIELDESKTIATGIVDELLQNIEITPSTSEDDMKAMKCE